MCPVVDVAVVVFAAKCNVEGEMMGDLYAVRAVWRPLREKMREFRAWMRDLSGAPSLPLIVGSEEELVDGAVEGGWTALLLLPLETVLLVGLELFGWGAIVLMVDGKFPN